VPGLTTDDKYAEAVRDTRMFLEGRRTDLMGSLESRMLDASDSERYEQAASYRDLLHTLAEIEERQKIAAAEGDDIDVLAWHAEPPLVAVNLFHLRGGRVVDRRDFYWEDLDEFEPAEFLSSLLKQLYLDAAYLPRAIHIPMDFEDRELLEQILTQRGTHLEPPRSRVEILMPQRGAKHAFLELVEKNARHSFEQRFRVMKPTSKAIVEALEQALGLPEPPRRIESFDISHLQGSDTVASMVVWEDGRMKKSDYRKFIIKGEWGNDDFASMREVIERRYRRLLEEKKTFPGLILIDGGLGQLHAAAASLEKLEVINQAVASIAKQEEIVYVLGQEDQPIRLEHHSPILHLIQQIRDETHRFAVGFHRQRRAKRTIQTGLENIPGVGPRTALKLLRRFGSITQLRSASVEQIARVVSKPVAERVSAHLAAAIASPLPDPKSTQS
jgi:excinuclease ABC subunit C